MEWWDTFVIVLLLFLAVIGLARPFMKLKKGSPKDVSLLLDHLQGMGIYATLSEVDKKAGARGARRASMERCQGAIKIGGRNVDLINVVSKATPFGDRLFADYSVGTGLWLAKTSRKKTGLVRKGALGVLGGGGDIEWKGDEWLCRELNYDPRLKDKLGQAEMEGGLSILPGSECAKVRVAYQLPSANLFEVIDIIAGHIRSVW
ncbi:MAG: hypothetical protein JSW30_04305 [Dehalococcoidia bacterium]|nr:MAG: hypothetical protein JSW30_04305 [Dehalococcoidia bacterium]